jgi:1,4-alpha-glucan branching enzyme
MDWHLLQFPDQVSVERRVRDLNFLHRTEQFLSESDFDPRGFSWAVVDDEDNSMVAFFRHGKNGEFLLAVCNLTPVMRRDSAIGVPHVGYWREVLNGDGDTRTGNCGGCWTHCGAAQGYKHYIAPVVPGLSALFFFSRGKKSILLIDSGQENSKLLAVFPRIFLKKV